MSRAEIQDQISYFKAHPLKSMRVRGWFQLIHPDSMVQFNCLKHPHIHGTHWLKPAKAHADEDEHGTACPVCLALLLQPEDDAVPFAELKEQVEKQRAVNDKLRTKAASKANKRHNGAPRFAI